jgi:hypothetical protein
MDSRLFGSSKVGNRVFENCLFLFESVLNEATKKYPNQTLRLSFDTKMCAKEEAKLNIFVEAVPEESHTEKTHDLEEFFQTNEEGGADITPYDPYPNLSMYELHTESYVNGELVEGPLQARSKDTWTMRMKLNAIHEQDDYKKKTSFRAMRKKQASVYLPKENRGNNPHLKILKGMSDRMLQQTK